MTSRKEGRGSWAGGGSAVPQVWSGAGRCLQRPAPACLTVRGCVPRAKAGLGAGTGSLGRWRLPLAPRVCRGSSWHRLPRAGVLPGQLFPNSIPKTPPRPGSEARAGRTWTGKLPGTLEVLKQEEPDLICSGPGQKEGVLTEHPKCNSGQRRGQYPDGHRPGRVTGGPSG